jgi:hypothetical protein
MNRGSNCQNPAKDLPAVALRLKVGCPKEDRLKEENRRRALARAARR